MFEFSGAILTLLPWILAPLPLYSTLQVLSGYTFGAWVGGIVSYVSAFLGALFVFGMSRLYFHRTIKRCLSHTV